MQFPHESFHNHSQHHNSELTMKQSHPVNHEISDVSRETYNAVLSEYEKNRDAYSELIGIWLQWNQSVNLFSKRTDQSLLRNHIFHSLFLVKETMISDAASAETIIDAGTGGGLPGLPMAIACPDKHFILVDKVAKKTMAVKDIIRSLGIANVRVANQDIESVEATTPARVVSKHAFHVSNLLKALQGKNIQEISMLKGDDVLSEININIVNANRITLKRFNIQENPFFQNKYIIHLHQR